MTPASSTPESWDERHQHLFGLRSALAEVAHTVSIDIAELIVGDQLLISAQPFVVTGCQPDGPVIHVEAVRDTRTITTEYLRIERVDVVAPRPPTSCPPDLRSLLPEISAPIEGPFDREDHLITPDEAIALLNANRKDRP